MNHGAAVVLKGVTHCGFKFRCQVRPVALSKWDLHTYVILHAQLLPGPVMLRINTKNYWKWKKRLCVRLPSGTNTT